MSEEIKDSETLYKLIISQLRYDGLDLIATSLSKCVGLEEVALAPSSRLFEIMKMGLQEEKAGREPEQRKVPGLTPLVQPEAIGLETKVKHGLDLEYERDGDDHLGFHNLTTNHQSDALTSFRCDPGALNNLDLLSQVSLTKYLEHEFSFDKTSPTLMKGRFGCDQKLEFLSSLDLIPTPLMKECPNATRKWLETTSKQQQPIKTSPNDVTGMNTYALYGNPMFSGDFNVIADHLICLPTTSNSQNFSNHSVCDNLSHTSISKNAMVKNTKHVNSMSESVANYSLIHSNIDDLKREIQCFDKQVQTDTITINVQPVFETLQEKVAKEIMEQGITQKVFAACSIGKSQGYLSELLNSINTIKHKNHVSKGNQLIWEIRRFLFLPVEERRTRYNEYYKSSSDIQLRDVNQTVDIKKKHTRTKITADVKLKLVEFFESKQRIIGSRDVKEISETLNINQATVKIFYKNLKQRRKDL